jgi:hypothetical protein
MFALQLIFMINVLVQINKEYNTIGKNVKAESRKRLLCLKKLKKKTFY